jgi:hypothetical protein
MIRTLLEGAQFFCCVFIQGYNYTGITVADLKTKYSYIQSILLCFD